MLVTINVSLNRGSLIIGILAKKVGCTNRWARAGSRACNAVGTIHSLSLIVRGHMDTLPSDMGKRGTPAISLKAVL